MSGMQKDIWTEMQAVRESPQAPGELVAEQLPELPGRRSAERRG